MEEFVRRYRETYDGETAARESGYEKPHEIWPELLAVDRVKARLRFYRAGVGEPVRKTADVFENLFDQVFGNLDEVLVPDVITNEIRIDWEKAAKQKSALLDFEESIIYNGGIPQRTTTLRKRGNFSSLQLLAQNIEKMNADTESSDKLLSYNFLLREYSKQFQTVPVVPDDPASRLARMNRRVVSQPDDEEEEEIEP